MQKPVSYLTRTREGGEPNTFIAKLDPDLDSKVNNILNRMPSHLKANGIQTNEIEAPRNSLREILQTGPFNRNPSSQYGSATNQIDPIFQSYFGSQSLEKKEQQPQSFSENKPEEQLAHSYRLRSQKVNEKKPFAATPSQDKLEPLRAYQESLNRRVEDTLRRSQMITRSPRNTSPKRSQLLNYSQAPSYSQTPSKVFKFDNDRLNSRIEEALSKSGTKLKRSGYAGPSNRNGWSFLSPQARHVQRYYENNYGLDNKDKGLPINSLIKTFAERAMTDSAFKDGLKKSQALFQKSSRAHVKEQPPLLVSGFLDSNQKSTLYSSQDKLASPKGYISKSPSKLRDALINSHLLELKPTFVDEHYNDGTAYRGDVLRGKKSGRGTFVYADGSKYDGEWDDGERNGYGIQMNPNGEVLYEGEWLRGKYHGTGTLVNPSSTKFKGEFDYKNFSDLRNFWEKYDGEFDLGKWNGLGTIYLTNGEKLVSKFRYGKVHGTGTFYQLSDKDVTGEWKEDKFVAEF